VHLGLWVAISRRRIIGQWTSLLTPFISAQRLFERSVEYCFSCLTGQQQASYHKNKLINKSKIKNEKAKIMCDSINYPLIPKEVLLPDRAHRNLLGTKGDGV
jgi:hypothetical protein